MGASTSVQNIENSIYISYDYGEKNNIFIHELIQDLKKNKYNVVYSELINKEFDKSDNVKNMVNAMEQIVDHSHLIIICISKRTLYNYYQTIEMNSAIQSNKNILFLMIDENYSSEKKPLFAGLVKNKWLPLYNYDNLSDVLFYIKYKNKFQK